MHMATSVWNLILPTLATFWTMTSLVIIFYQIIAGNNNIPFEHYFDDESKIFLWQIGEFLPEYTASYTRRHNSL